MLELRHLSYAVHEDGGELGILNDISLTVGDGQLVVFTGPNGGGKTTLAKSIMGLVKPTAGQILWNGQDVTDMGITERARVGLCANDYLDREVDASLSGGEVKRIEIASILARQAPGSSGGGSPGPGKLMIFDEPEAGIDLWSFARLTETFEQLHAAGGATMIIIISLADEVIVVGDGRLRHRGSPAEILPQILADTLGACPVMRKEAMAQ